VLGSIIHRVCASAFNFAIKLCVFAVTFDLIYASGEQ